MPSEKVSSGPDNIPYKFSVEVSMYIDMAKRMPNYLYWAYRRVSKVAATATFEISELNGRLLLRERVLSEGA